MVRTLSGILFAALVLGGCSAVRESRYNPFNWFGRGQSEPVRTVVDGQEINPLIPRRAAISVFRQNKEEVYRGRLISQVTELHIDRYPGGAIVRATGVSSRQGPFDVRLVKVDAESSGDTITYDFRMLQSGPAGGPEGGRVVTVATNLSDAQLQGIRVIRVKSATNIQTSRR